MGWSSRPWFFPWHSERNGTAGLGHWINLEDELLGIGAVVIGSPPIYKWWNGHLEGVPQHGTTRSLGDENDHHGPINHWTKSWDDPPSRGTGSSFYSGEFEHPNIQPGANSKYRPLGLVFHYSYIKSLLNNPGFTRVNGPFFRPFFWRKSFPLVNHHI